MNHTRMFVSFNEAIVNDIYQWQLFSMYEFTLLLTHLAVGFLAAQNGDVFMGTHPPF